MREHMSQWDFVTAAYAVGVGATVLLILWTFIAMHRAEKRRDLVTGKRAK